MRIRPREVQTEGASVAGLPMLIAATMLAVLFLAASPAWAQEATHTPGTERTPDLSEEAGEGTAEVPRARYDEETGERVVNEVTDTETPASEGSNPSSPAADSGPGAAEPTAEPAAEPVATSKVEPLPKPPAPQAPKEQTPLLPKTGGVDLLPIFLGTSCLAVGALSLLLGHDSGRLSARLVDRPPEGR